MTDIQNRSNRVKRLKKLILGTIALAILIPIIACVILFVKVNNLQKQVLQLTEKSEEKFDELSGIYTTSEVISSKKEGADSQKEAEHLEEENVKKIYLTFDDGPSTNTDKILDILDEYQVKATFFVVGKTDEKSKALYQRIVEEGHTLGMHSYSHSYQEIYASREAFVSDINKLQEYLYELTGVWPRIYRFPGGSSNTVSSVDMQELIQYLSDMGIVYYDWNVASGDAVSKQLPVSTIVNNSLSQIDNLDESVILFHDAAEKRTTVEALPQIIEAIKEREDAVILPITDDTVPVQHRVATVK